MKGSTSRESEDKNPRSKDEEALTPNYRVDYNISYDIDPPYTVLVD